MDRKTYGQSPSPACSAWPDAPGFYWWRGAPSFRWEMMQVLAHGADETDQSRYMVHKVEAHNVCRSLQAWKERGPACGEWVKIRQPETLEEMEARHLQDHVCAMNRDMMGTCFVCGSSSLPNDQAHGALCGLRGQESQVLHPCADCGTLRSKKEGGTTFTICDECWDRHETPNTTHN